MLDLVSDKEQFVDTFKYLGIMSQFKILLQKTNFVILLA